MNRKETVGCISNNCNELELRRENQLVSAAQRGSSEAFEALEKTYSHRLYRTIISITKTPEDAEDALQDTLLQAYSSLSGFEGRSTIYSWLTRIAINSALTILRRRRARPEILFDPNETPEEDSPHFELKDPAPGAEEICDQRQRLFRVFHAILNLEPTLRAPFLMKITQGWSIKQIGRALGISDTAVKTRLHRARLRLSTAPALEHSKIGDRNVEGELLGRPQKKAVKEPQPATD